MKIFLTGATGFVGSHLARVLIGQGCEVLALVRPQSAMDRLVGVEKNLEILEGDLSRPSSYQSALSKWNPEACIHLAWYAEPGQYLHSPKNLESYKNSIDLIGILAEAGCQSMVTTGSCAEYDNDRGYLFEDGPTKPSTLYAATKLSLCLVGQKLAESANMKFAWARFFYLYGPMEDERRLVPDVIRSLLKKQAFDATLGEQVRDYLYVEDVASALWCLAKERADGIFNIASGKPISVAQIINAIGNLLDANDLIHLGAKPYRDWEPMFICGNNQKLRSLGWEPKVDLQEGLKRSIEWFGS